ncbi:MAG: DUF4136 domain-containing protein [Planctomycetota bacterium]|jgi:hypothetical protein
MKVLRAFLTLLFVLITSCSTITVTYDYDVEADFASLKTFDWWSVPAEPGADELAVKLARNAVNRQLQAKGFTRAAEYPDFFVALHGGKQTKLDIVDWGYSYGRHRPHGGYWHGRGIDAYEYQEGTLIVDFVDADTKELIWRGSARAVINPDRTPEQRSEKINEAVSKLLENFPPGKKR